MKLSRYLLVLILIYSHNGFGCLNEYRPLLNGKIEMSDSYFRVPRGRFGSLNPESLKELLYKSDSIYRKTKNSKDYSDYGVMLIYNGRYNEAKKIFQNIEKSTPRLYATAANIGTVYELMGINDSAYYWIERAIKLNPNSHKGSEWIHLKILEAKIHSSGSSDPHLTSSILSLDFGNTNVPENKNNLNLDKLQDQLSYQLNERITFIKPPDLIVGQLFFELGNVIAINEDVSVALEAYNLAREYGYSTKLMNEREKHFQHLQWRADLLSDTEDFAKNNLLITFLIVIVVFASIITGLVYVIKGVRRRISAS